MGESLGRRKFLSGGGPGARDYGMVWERVGLRKMFGLPRLQQSGARDGKAVDAQAAASGPGLAPLRKAPGVDWIWRPPLWSGAALVEGQSAIGNKAELGPHTTVFHDGLHSDIHARQIGNPGGADLAPFGLQLEVFNFDGGFVSVVLDLPADMCQGLRQKHVVAAELHLRAEPAFGVMARLNVKHGPNTEQISCEARAEGGDKYLVEFDLFYTQLNEKRISHAWIDLLFDRPLMTQINLDDVIVSRRPRAEL